MHCQQQHFGAYSRLPGGWWIGNQNERDSSILGVVDSRLGCNPSESTVVADNPDLAEVAFHLGKSESRVEEEEEEEVKVADSLHDLPQRGSA